MIEFRFMVDKNRYWKENYAPEFIKNIGMEKFIYKLLGDRKIFNTKLYKLLME